MKTFYDSELDSFVLIVPEGMTFSESPEVLLKDEVKKIMDEMLLVLTALTPKNTEGWNKLQDWKKILRGWKNVNG